MTYTCIELGVDIIVLSALSIYACLKIRPIYDKLDRFTKMIVWLVLMATSCNVLSYILALVGLA